MRRMIAVGLCAVLMYSGIPGRSWAAAAELTEDLEQDLRALEARPGTESLLSQGGGGLPAQPLDGSERRTLESVGQKAPWLLQQKGGCPNDSRFYDSATGRSCTTLCQCGNNPETCDCCSTHCSGGKTSSGGSSGESSYRSPAGGGTCLSDMSCKPHQWVLILALVGGLVALLMSVTKGG